MSKMLVSQRLLRRVCGDLLVVFVQAWSGILVFERLLSRAGNDLFVASEDVVSKIWVCHRLLSTVCDGLCIAFVQERSGVIRSRVIVIVDLFVAFVQAWPEIRFFRNLYKGRF